MKRKKILIIDDDQDLSMIIGDMYEDYGYTADIAVSGECAYDLLSAGHYDLILLDINLPGTTGFELCRELRKISDIPIIFASARTGEDDRITGLDIGGDDYLAKPYSMRELLSRTNSLIRRTYGFAQETQEITLENNQDNRIVLKAAERSAVRNGVPVKLALKEFDLLWYLSVHRGEAVKKEVLLREIWGTYSDVEMSTLTVHIRWLREKLEQNPSNPEYIKTIWGVGYEIVPENPKAHRNGAVNEPE